LRGICGFLQVPYDPRMVLLENAERSAIYEADHHANVKGKKIRPSGPRKEVLSPALKRKIARYSHLWREQYDGTWPMFAEPESAVAGNPNWLERLSDSLLYRSYKTFDQLILLLYCFAPIPLLRMYREMKRPPEVAKQGARVPSSGAD